MQKCLVQGSVFAGVFGIDPGTLAVVGTEFISIDELVVKV
jgi:hypothetical protein